MNSSLTYSLQEGSQFSKGHSSSNSGKARLLEGRLLKADPDLEQFSCELETQKEELRSQQEQLREVCEPHVISLI